MRQTIRESYLASEQMSVGIAYVQIGIARESSGKSIMVVGGKLLVVGYVGYYARQFLGIETRADVQSAVFSRLEHEHEVVRLVVRQPVFYAREDVQSLQLGERAVDVLWVEARMLLQSYLLSVFF